MSTMSMEKLVKLFNKLADEKMINNDIELFIEDDYYES